ncbi:hypothetical protein BGX23_004781, partial [Mortierella sp. AD031]
NGGGAGVGAAGEYDEELAMDELWRRYQRQRPEDPATLMVHGEITNGGHPGDSSNGNSMGGNGVSSEGDSASGTRNDRASSSENMVAERLWEYVVGWFLIGCIFVGAALIVGANFTVHGDPASATPWTFKTEEGDSLMDNIVAHIMRAALGMQDFEDQLMEHGIFVFIVGINGFVLVRQRVFERRRHHEQELLRGGMLPIEMGKEVAGSYDLEGRAGGGDRVGDEGDGGEGYSEGKRDSYEDVHHHQATQGVERFTTTDQVAAQTAALTANITTSGAGAGAGAGARGGGCVQSTPISSADHRAGQPPTSVPLLPRARENSMNSKEQVEEKLGDDGSPDFATMSFLAWFNYLQVGILIIEFLQLFSFPLRELMEFYNQAAKTSAMYEGAKTILNVFRTTATDSTIGNDQVSSAAAAAAAATTGSTSGIHYKDGILSIGNNTLPTFALEIPEKDKEVTAAAAAAVLDQHADDMEWLLKHAPSHAVNATEAVTSTTTHQSGAQKLGASVDWIKENLPSWLPNITALMDNNTVDGSRFEELRDNLVNAAVGVTLQGFGEAINSTAGSNVTTLSGVNGDSSGKVKSPTGKMSGGSGSNSGDGDIVMQVVNSLGPQSSINTHDWYLLRFWSCFVAVVLGWIIALSIHAWNRRCRRLRREGRPHWNAISVGWVSCFIPVVQEQARREGHGSIQATGIFSSVMMTLLDPASTVAPSASSLLCTGPLVQPALYLTATRPAKGEICFRPNGVAVLKNLGLLLAVDFLLIQSPAQRRFRGLVSIGIMLAMACYTIRMKPCYWNKVNYWRTFSFSYVLYGSLLVALLCPSPAAVEKAGKAVEREHRVGEGRWVMAPHLKMGPAWMVGGGHKVMLAWIVAGWVLLVIVFVLVERVFLRHWTKKVAVVPVPVRPPVALLSDGYGGHYRGCGDMYGGPDFRSLRGEGVGGEVSGFEPAVPGPGGMNTNPTMSGSHWSVVDLSQTPEARRSKGLNSS